MATAVSSVRMDAAFVRALIREECGKMQDRSDIWDAIDMLRARVDRMEIERTQTGEGQSQDVFERHHDGMQSRRSDSPPRSHRGTKMPSTFVCSPPPSRNQTPRERTSATDARSADARREWSSVTDVLLSETSAPAKKDRIGPYAAETVPLLPIGTHAASGWKVATLEEAKGRCQLKALEEGANEEQDSPDIEDWEFEADAYSLGLVAITKRSMYGAMPYVFIAFLTPLLQGICFSALFQFMMTKGSFEENAGGMRIIVNFVCFLLMGLDLTNEVLEGFQKLIFCCRCASGMYVGVNPRTAYIALMLALFQTTIPCYIVGLSMKLVAGAETVLDAFMNYVALLFITEIDNYLTDSRIISNVLDMDTTVRVRRTAEAAAAALSGREVWTCHYLVITNAVTFPLIAFNGILVFMLWQAGVRKGESPDKVVDPQWWQMQLPAFFVALVLLDGTMWCGSKRFGTVTLAVPLSILALLCTIALYLLHIHGSFDLVQPMTTNTLILFSMIGLATAGGAAVDPFDLLKCPVRLPLVSWLILYACVLWTEHLNSYGYG